MTKTVNRKSLISWIVTLALPIIILLIPTTEAFTTEIRTFFAITLMGIAMFCFDEMDNAIAGILMMLLYIMTGVAPSGTVFSAWTNDIPWYILATLLLVNILEDTTILKRIAYHCIIAAGGAVHGHPDGSEAGARSMRQAIDAALNGIPLEEAIKTAPELEKMVKKLGWEPRANFDLMK